MQGFPADKLVASHGEIYCHLFENALTGLPRNVYWSFTVGFELIQYVGDVFHCSMTCEWLTFAIRDWRKISGQKLVLKYGEKGSESSFYHVDHDIGTSTRLEINRIHDAGFEINMEMIVDFTGYSDNDQNPSMIIRGRTIVPFVGLIIVPEELGLTRNSTTAILDVVSPFFDVTNFKAPIPRSHGFLMEPKIV